MHCSFQEWKDCIAVEMVNGPMETDDPPQVCKVISAEVAPLSLHRLLDPACCVFDLRVYGEAIKWMCRRVGTGFDVNGLLLRAQVQISFCVMCMCSVLLICPQVKTTPAVSEKLLSLMVDEISSPGPDQSSDSECLPVVPEVEDGFQ